MRVSVGAFTRHAATAESARRAWDEAGDRERESARAREREGQKECGPRPVRVCARERGFRSVCVEEMDRVGRGQCVHEAIQIRPYSFSLASGSIKKLCVLSKPPCALSAGPDEAGESVMIYSYRRVLGGMLCS